MGVGVNGVPPWRVISFGPFRRENRFSLLNYDRSCSRRVLCAYSRPLPRSEFARARASRNERIFPLNRDLRPARETFAVTFYSEPEL